MEIKTLEAQYELIELNHYIDYSKTEVNIIDMVIKASNIEFMEDELSNAIVVSSDSYFYSLTDYELIECYDIGNNLIRAVYIK